MALCFPEVNAHACTPSTPAHTRRHSNCPKHMRNAVLPSLRPFSFPTSHLPSFPPSLTHFPSPSRPRSPCPPCDLSAGLQLRQHVELLAGVVHILDCLDQATPLQRLDDLVDLGLTQIRLHLDVARPDAYKTCMHTSTYATARDLYPCKQGVHGLHVTTYSHCMQPKRFVCLTAPTHPSPSHMRFACTIMHSTSFILPASHTCHGVLVPCGNTSCSTQHMC